MKCNRDYILAAQLLHSRNIEIDVKWNHQKELSSGMDGNQDKWSSKINL
jgi:hypothetical protein